MTVLEGIRLALIQIRAQKLKSFFGVLGVVIGVTFLIVVVGVVEGLDRYMTEEFASQVYGINTVTVRRVPSVQFNPDIETRRGWARRPRLTHADADAIRERLDLSARVGVESRSGGTVRGESGRTVENVTVSAASPEIFAIRSLAVAQGRVFSAQEAERGLPVVVLGKSTADAVFPGLDPVGRHVRIAGGSAADGARGFRYRVVGVLEEQGSVLGISQDNRAIAPATSEVRTITNPRRVVDEILVQVDDPARVDELRVSLEAIMRGQHRLRPTEAADFELETADESLDFWDQISRMLYVALPGLVSIALVVGGIVIMNIMLVSVMERTREIGVRKAIGARRRDIVFQVLVESATLSGVGGLAGIGIGLGLGALVRTLSPLPVSISLPWISVGLALGVGVGVAAGVYPAARASRLDPVDALRHE